jgi:hypothetical protein
MLQIVRKYTQGWVATVMGVILTFAFVLWGIENYLGGHAKKQIAAKVNGKEITTAQVSNDFERSLLRIKDQVGANYNLPASLQQQLKAQALNSLIIQNILIQAAFKAGFNVVPQETAAFIKQMPAFQENGQFSKDRFEHIINRMGYTQPEFFDDVSKSLVLNQIASGIEGTGFMLPNELNQAIMLLTQKRDIQYAVISRSNFKQNDSPSSMSINAYYEQNKNQFKVPAKVQIEYVMLAAEEMKKTLPVSAKEMENFFETNNNLNKTDPKAIEQAKETVRQQKLEQEFSATSDKLADLAYTNPDSLNTAATNLGLKIRTSDFFTQEGGNTDITKNPKIIATAFSNILKNNTNSNLIEIAPGKVAVIRVKSYRPDTFVPLEEVREKIKEHLIAVNSANKASEAGVLLLQKIRNREDFKKIIAEQHLSLVTKEQISRQDKNINPNILRVAFSISPDAQKPIAGTQLANGNFVLVSVNKINSKVDNDQRMANTIGKLYSDSYGKVDLDLYILNQINSAKIKTY